METKTRSFVHVEIWRNNATPHFVDPPITYRYPCRLVSLTTALISIEVHHSIKSKSTIMAPNKKKKKKLTTLTESHPPNSSTSKRQPRKLSVPELIQAAEHAATTMMDLKNAITLYTMALQKLLSQPQDPVANLETSMFPNQNEDRVSVNQTDNTDATASNSATTNTMILDIYEKRAELYIDLQQTDMALQDYQELLRHLQRPEADSHGVVLLLLRQATVHMSMGQLSQAEEALQSYQSGKQCLRTALTTITPQQQQPGMSQILHTTTTTATVPPQQLLLLQEEIQQQYCRVCCCIAELYLTDLCYSDQAEQLCEESLQESLSIIQAMSPNQYPDTATQKTQQHHCIETYQMIASLRFSQKRNTEAHKYMKQVYEPMAVGCQALAILVGLRSDTRRENDPDMAIELTALDHVQSLPPVEFRISTSKLLLECAGTLATTADTTTDGSDQNVRDCIATPEQQEYAVMAMDVIGSCLAEQDEMYECWILLGDAMIFLEKESAWSYWNRALQILLPIQQQLQQELRDAGDHNESGNHNDDDDEDPIQQQLDTILVELDQLQERMDWAQRSGYDDENENGKTTTTDGMEE